jgi:hypothetical protein
VKRQHLKKIVSGTCQLQRVHPNLFFIIKENLTGSLQNELEKVSKVLDKAIERDQHHYCHNLYKVMILRADMAVAQQNPDKAKALLEQVCSSPDVVQNPGKYKVVLQRVDDIMAKMK